MKIFTYDALPGRIIFEPGASLLRLATEVKRMGVSRILLIATERERTLVKESYPLPPHVVAFNEPAIPTIMGKMASAIGTQSAAAGLYDLAMRIGAPTALKNIGMKVENLNEAITLIMEKAPEDNPRPVDEVGIRTILENAYAGRHPERVLER